ncbi:MAG: 50S ribosomal protein L3 [Planctomycetes bacterium]|nr:50S ribosomal protein L3 [Planctomycetota bacterium]
MVKMLIGEKKGMTQIFDDSGTLVPVTVLQVGPCVVTQVKTLAKDGTDAVQIGFGEAKPGNVNKPLRGHFAKAGVTARTVLKDVVPEGDQMPQLGDELRVGSVFDGVSHVDVIGISKGRGFAGVVRRHGFSGSPATHGGRFGRHGGSIGTSATPAHVLKGKKMAGHMGAERITVRNLEVVKLDADHDLLLVKGSVPGCKGGYVLVRKALRR